MTYAQPFIRAVYLGGPTVLLEIEGLRFMTDPTLDKKGTAYPLGEQLILQKTLDPFLADPGPVDYVLLSHQQHPDNLDHKGRALLQHVKKVYTTPESAGELEAPAKGLQPWESDTIFTAGGSSIIITATPARHGPAGTEAITGAVTGFIITVKGKNNYEIYITGDTVFYEEVQEVARRYQPHYVLAFAGAVLHWNSIYMTMNDSDVINTAFAFPGATIIPVHYEGWKHYTRDASGIIQTFDRLGIGARLRLLNKGIPTLLPVR